MSKDERDFIASIDCKFPYTDLALWKKAIERGIEMSPNASFMVLHEICRPPHGAPVRRAQLNEILKYWLEKFEHPMAIVIGEVASKMIQHHDIPIEDAIRRMHDLSAYPGLYAALGILNFVCDDSAGELEKVYAEIVKGWEAQIDPSQPPSRPPPPQIEC